MLWFVGAFTFKNLLFWFDLFLLYIHLYKMSFSDNDNWMDELDFFPNLKPDFECSGLGTISLHLLYF